MKKRLFIPLLLIFISVTVSGQIDFINQTNQLPSKGTSFEAVEIGDINNDGRNDIVVGSSFYFDDLNDFSIFIYKQNADGSLASPIRISYPISNPRLRDIELGDFNNDQRLDIAIGYQSSLGIFYQLPTGEFSAISAVTGISSYNGIKSGDLNNDGLTDIVGYENQSYKLFLQKPTGGFTVNSIPSKISNFTKLEIKDMNDDNLNDIVNIYGSKIEILYQKNGVTITKDSCMVISSRIDLYSSFSGMTVGDLNNDGRNDLAVAYGGNAGRLSIYYQKSDGKLDTLNVKKLNTHDIPTAMEIADLNCDGFNEIVIGHHGFEKVSVFSKSATVDYSNYTLFPGLYYYTPFSMAVGDVNGDQKPDVVSVGQNAMITILNNKSKPLTFDSIRQETASLLLKRDTNDVKSVAYIPIQDTATFCKRNDYIRQLNVQTFANEHYSGDSLTIRYGTMCSSFCDTLKTAFAYTRRFLLKTVVTDSVANYDTLTTTTTSIIYASAIKSSESMSIYSNTCWNISADADWIKPSVNIGSGEAEIRIEMDENPKTAPRTGAITLYGDRVASIHIRVYQFASKPFVSTSASVAVLSEHVNNKVLLEIKSNSAWEVVTDTEWLSFDKISGTEEDLLTIQGVQNETNEHRVGRVGFFCNGEVVTIIPVLQLKKGSNGVVYPSVFVFPDNPNQIQNKTFIQKIVKQ